jgi:(1->4)-alpha-D-glucan 1-alpha-D-glucosylmutase
LARRTTGSGEALARLAALAGIAGSYRDAWGTRRTVPVGTKRALLAAMGFDLSTPGAVALSLKAMEERPWRRALEPVLVAREGGSPHAIPIVLASPAKGRLGWRLEAEDGTRREGEARPASLPVLEARRIDGLARERRLLELAPSLEPGYYRVTLCGDGLGETGEAQMTLIVAPSRCYVPPALSDGGGTWGFAVQVYGLRSPANWGMGDFGDLSALAEGAARLGAGVVGINPLHALFPTRPEHAGPYGPSSRVFLNVLYTDVEAVPDFADCPAAQATVGAPEFRRALAQSRKSPFVDYAGVAARKLRVLELVFRCFCDRHLGPKGRKPSPRGGAFRRFQAEGGRALECHALFDALSEHFTRTDSGSRSWRDWLAPYRDPGSRAVARFTADHKERIEFFQYLQWQAELQLGSVAEICRELEMGVGLYRDLAVGVDGNGGEAWAQQGLLANGASVGAPPDPFNLRGQNWGLPPVNPVALREEAYASFVALLRANMRHAGALRVDHVMGWTRVFWIPDGASPVQGGYVRYPFDDLLGIAALESHRNRCMVIGEDLGTVPRGLRNRLWDARILSYRLLYFERDKRGGFLAPKAYPDLSLVAVTTHDLPTLPGFWKGHDLALRAGLDLFPSRKAENRALRARARDRRLLLEALAREGLMPPDLAGRAKELTELSPDLVEAVYRYLARTRASLLMVQFEDLLGEVEQVNLPGTTDQHPNWQRKQRLDIAATLRDPRVVRLAELLRRMRPPRSHGRSR